MISSALWERSSSERGVARVLISSAANWTVVGSAAPRRNASRLPPARKLQKKKKKEKGKKKKEEYYEQEKDRVWMYGKYLNATRQIRMKKTGPKGRKLVCFYTKKNQRKNMRKTKSDRLKVLFDRPLVHCCRSMHCTPTFKTENKKI